MLLRIRPCGVSVPRLLTCHCRPGGLSVSTGTLVSSLILDRPVYGRQPSSPSTRSRSTGRPGRWHRLSRTLLASTSSQEPRRHASHPPRRTGLGTSRARADPGLLAGGRRRGIGSGRGRRVTWLCLTGPTSRRSRCVLGPAGSRADRKPGSGVRNRPGRCAVSSPAPGAHAGRGPIRPDGWRRGRPTCRPRWRSATRNGGHGPRRDSG